MPVVQKQNNRQITDFFKSRPTSRQSRDSIVVGGDPDPNGRRRQWPSVTPSPHTQGRTTAAPELRDEAPSPTPPERSQLNAQRPNTRSPRQTQPSEPATTKQTNSSRPSSSQTSRSDTSFNSSPAKSTFKPAPAGPAADDMAGAWPLTSSQGSRAGTSFTSSFNSSSTHSRRVVKNGEEVVRASDSEEDSDSSLEELPIRLPRKATPTPALSVPPAPAADDGNSSSDLDELDAIIPMRKKGQATASASAPRPANSKPVNGMTTRSKVGDVRSFLKRRPPPLQKPKYKFSLASLASMARSTEEADIKVAEAKSLLDVVDMPDGSDDPTAGAPVDEKLLTSVVDDPDGEGRAGKLFAAMHKTDVFRKDAVYNFFGGEDHDMPSEPFPSKSLPSAGWPALLREPTQREQTFLCGFAEQMVRHQQLPDEILLWMMDELTTQTNSHLSSSYMRVLEASSKQAGKLLSTARLLRAVEHLGGRKAALERDSLIQPSYRSSTTPVRRPPSRLKWVLEMIRALTPELSPDTQADTLMILLRLGIDDSVMANVTSHIHAGDSIAALVTKIPEDTLLQVSRAVFQTLQNPSLRQHLLTVLPCTSPQVHRFRRHLALAFLFNDIESLESDFASPWVMARVTDHLRNSPSFCITKDADYTALSASVTFLDIAIDAGFSNLNFSTISTPTPNNLTADTKPTEAGKAFNHSIDQLAELIRAISNQIKDAGMASMQKTKVKQQMISLEHRLISAVRTKLKVNKGTFGVEEEREKVDNFYKRWMERKTVAGPENGHDGE